MLNSRISILLSLLIITPVGLLSKTYTGIGQEWIQDYSGDVLYEIFWCLVAFWFVRPAKDLKQLRKTTSKIALWVFVITCAIEVSQLWFHLVPVTIRTSFMWRMLSGSLIGWWLVYQIGCVSKLK